MAQEPVDHLMQFAEALRSKGGVENRSGVLDGQRVELFRGKDLVRWVKANPDKCAKAPGGKIVTEPDELARHLGQQLLRRRLALRVDRLNKKPLPGSTKMVKFPRKLVNLPGDQAMSFVEDGFYVWLYERPVSPWTYVWTALIPLGVVGACLFPLAPNWVKIAVLYLSSGLLALLLGTLLLRSALAAVTWVVSGRTVWLLPNAMSEELPISQIFKPLVSVSHPPEGSSKWSNHPLTRLAVGAVLGGLLYVLYSHSPDKGKHMGHYPLGASMATEATRYRDDLFDWLGVQKEGYHRITSSNDTAAAANATAADAEAGAAGAADGAAGAEAAGAEAGAEAGPAADGEL